MTVIVQITKTPPGFQFSTGSKKVKNPFNYKIEAIIYKKESPFRPEPRDEVNNGLQEKTEYIGKGSCSQGVELASFSYTSPSEIH